MINAKWKVLIRDAKREMTDGTGMKSLDPDVIHELRSLGYFDTFCRIFTGKDIDILTT